ncbi:MAG TPA: sulfatase [Lapillicoccus sp.]|nr:sulfatase [Lapillicoccus sp.]
MPLRGSREPRWLAAAVMVAVTGLTAAACSTGDTQSHGPDGGRHVVPKGPAPVRAPGAQDTVLPGKPLTPDPFTRPHRRPNLLMITVDDAAQKDMKYLPHVQHLMADEGTTLKNGIAPTPICVPARASLVSGQYAHNHGAVTINGAGGGFKSFPDEDTLPVWLQHAGYDTMFIGKYLNGYGEDGSEHYVPPGWSDWRATVDPSTYNFVRPTVNDNGSDRTYHQYSSDLFSDLTVDMLTDPARQQKPWYLWVNYVAPHTGGPDAPDDPSVKYPDDKHPLKTTTPAPRDVDRFANLDLPRTADMFEKDTSDKAIIHATHRHVDAVHRAEMREARQQRIEALQSVDRAVARTVRTLRSTGQLHNTYIAFTSDNGYVLGEHNLDGKLWYFREIAGIPMYLRGPGIRRGATSATPVTNADWAPTFAALAGATPTRKVDGTNVIPWLDTGASRRVVPIEGYPVRGGTTPIYTGVIVGPWTYVENRRGRAELYYRKVDPWQLNNLRRDPRYHQQYKQLRKLTHEYRDCAGTQCPSDFYR